MHPAVIKVSPTARPRHREQEIVPGDRSSISSADLQAMSDPGRFPSSRWLLAIAIGALAARSSTARADENLLQGPHPFLKDNELSLHVLIAEGQSDSLSGAKLAVDYGYKLGAGAAPTWLNLEINVEHGGCAPTPNNAPCGSNTGDVVETMAGAKWKLATPIPLVPFFKVAGGLVFAFANGASDAPGLAIRGGGGVNYFFFDWLGLGIEVGVSLGRIDYDATFQGSHTYSVFDAGGGLEFQF
jgi:hypothetical protein